MKCKYCKSLISFSQSHCSQCGAPLSNETVRPTQKLEEYRDDTKLAVSTFIFMTLLIIGMCAAIWYMQNQINQGLW